MKKIDLTGMRFERLNILCEIKERSKSKKVIWQCKCDCGRETFVSSAHLISGHTRSCGCIQREAVKSLDNSTHKDSKSATYYTWNSMKSRCYNPKNDSYYRYGGRGIQVCDRWLNSYENFLEDMGHKPDECSLDRINNDGNYDPTNCRWATIYEQANNMSNNVRMEYSGEIKTISQWARTLNIPRDKIYRRHKSHESLDKILKVIGYEI